MGKKRVSHGNAGPDMVDSDSLASMGDDELNNRLQRLESERELMKDQKIHARLWEIEIAYVKREQQIRRLRREMHDAYVTNNRSNDQIDVLSDEFESDCDNASA